MKYLLLTIFFVMSVCPVLAQSEDGEDGGDYIQSQIDSILSLITPQTPDSIKMKQYYNIGVVSDNTDTSLKYAMLSLELCKSDDYLYIADNNYNIGVSLYLQDKSREALDYFFMSMALFEMFDNSQKVAYNSIAIGKCYHELNLHDSSLVYLGKALDLFTELKDTSNITYTYQSIGSVNVDLNFHETAREYYLKALRLDSLAQNYLDVAYDYQVLGFMEMAIGNIEDAISNLIMSSYIFETKPTDDQYYVNAKYVTYMYLSETYITRAEKNSDTLSAIRCHRYLDKIGDYFITNGYNGNQFSKLQCYSRYLSFIGNDKAALSVLLECQKFLEDDQRDNILSAYYKYLTIVYKKLGDYKNALESSDKMHFYEKSSVNDSTMNVVAKFQADQEVKIHKAEAAAKQKQMRIIIISLMVVLVLVTLLVFIIFKAFKIKRKANEDLTQKNHILDQQKSEIEAQRDEILFQKTEIEKQKDIITKQWQAVEDVNIKLFSSINYAQRIQNAAISPKSEVDALFPENFVYYRPRDIVSGDYYRVAKCGRYNVMITADCTGHGIPGGFLSMLGISALKEFCVTENDAANPGTILDRMRSFIKATLISGDEISIDDGMDMTICSYDFDAMEMRYATANQLAVLVRNGKAISLHGDKMPVGRYVAEKEHFSTHSLALEKGDMVYSFSDGIQDQPGGEVYYHYVRKFLTKNLVALLTEIHDKPLDVQYQLLDESITAWRGNRMQVDDITLIGVRV